MGNWTKIIVVLTILSIGVAFGGYVFYTKEYVKPRQELAEKKQAIEAEIQNGKNQIEQMTKTTESLTPLYRRSFPTNYAKGGMEYQIWLTQMLEFCGVHESKVEVGKFLRPRPGYVGTNKFVVQGQFTLRDLTQFLYEFYWAPFLHRISTLNIQPQEHSDLLQASMTIEGLTIFYKEDRTQQYPLADKLPLDTPPVRQTSSGPFAAYRQLGDVEIFRAVKSGVDTTSYTKLTGTPVVTDEGGQPTKFARWSLGAEGRTQTYKIGDRMTIGAFDAVVEDIDSDIGMVLLRQGSGRLWAVPLGYNLSEAVAIPSTIY